MIEKTRSRRAVKIDKSALAIGEPERIRDEAYTRSANGRLCDVCELTGRSYDPATVVHAHANFSFNSGMGQKASDDCNLFLCFDCHKAFDQCGDKARALWLIVNFFIPWARQRYRKWKGQRMNLNTSKGG
jgi:hypothetical protein